MKQPGIVVAVAALIFGIGIIGMLSYSESQQADHRQEVERLTEEVDQLKKEKNNQPQSPSQADLMLEALERLAEEERRANQQNTTSSPNYVTESGGAQINQPQACIPCGGTGHGMTACYMCDGTGVNSIGFRCISCNGRGFSECASCWGTGLR